MPAVKPGGRPARHRRRESVTAILYVVRGGNQWRALPHDVPPWHTALYSLRKWRTDGTWEQLHTALRARTRRHLGREATPSAALLDRPSVQTSHRGAHAAPTRTSR